MTKHIVTFFALLFVEIISAQNLIPNPSFEEYTECPNEQFDIEKANPWTTYRQTPDFFHACDESGEVSTPLSVIYGYQIPFHGEGYAGFIAATYNTSREFLGVALDTPLEVGLDYYVSFQVSRAFGGNGHSNCDCAVNNLGLKFSTHAFSYENNMPTDNFAHIYTEEVIMDTVAWTQISGWITADSVYTHLGIGNFFENENNTIVNLNGYPFLKTYYFVDAVCVSTDSSFCNDFGPVSVRNLQTENKVKVYPNPAHTSIRIDSDQQITRVKIFDLCGKLIKNQQLINSNNEISIDELENGMYILIAMDTEKRVLKSTFIKH